MSEFPATQEEWGPAMAALANDKQRAFVLALFAAPRRRGASLFAATTAGYGTPTSNKKTLSAIAGRLMVDPRIRAAIAEETPKHLRALAPGAVRAVENLIADPKHRGHVHALAMVLDRASPLETTHNVNVVSSAGRYNDMPVAEVMRRIDSLIAKLNAPVAPSPKVIEGECITVEAAR